LYDICFGFLPAKFDASPDNGIILNEEDEVTDMYFIFSGEITVGFPSLGLSRKQFKSGITYKPNSYICDYYICFNQKSEFIYLATKNVEATRLSKYFLNDIF
jgi:hypothetical protein